MNTSASALGVIPARAHSSRFPFKIIHPIHKRPMIQYVWENAVRSGLFSRVIVATDHEDIAKVVKSFGGHVVLTPEFSSGSDRIAFIAKDAPEQVIVNLQGDEPLLQKESISILLETLEKHPESDLSTLAVWSQDAEELASPHVVKVVTDKHLKALYFSRSPIKSFPDGKFLKHIGIYAYRRNALLRYCALPASPLELSERLEQLRALENGMHIQVGITQFSTVAVDVPEDIQKVEKLISEGMVNK